MRNYLGFFVVADYGFTANNAAWVIGPIVNVVVNGAMFAAGTLTVGSAVCVWVGGQMIGVAILLVYVHVRLAGYGRPNVSLAWSSLRFGLKAHAGNVMLMGNYRMDQWLTGSISGSRELGLYSVAVAWAEGLFFLPTSLAAVQRPDVVRASHRGAADSAAAVFRAAILLTIPLAVGLTALPRSCATRSSARSSPRRRRAAAADPRRVRDSRPQAPRLGSHGPRTSDTRKLSDRRQLRGHDHARHHSDPPLRRQRRRVCLELRVPPRWRGCVRRLRPRRRWGSHGSHPSRLGRP